MRRFIAASIFAIASCSAVAKTEYGAQLQACVDKASTRVEADTCIHKIQDSWDKAGAPPAASTVAVPFDGGKAIDQ